MPADERAQRPALPLDDRALRPSSGRGPLGRPAGAAAQEQAASTAAHVGDRRDHDAPRPRYVSGPLRDDRRVGPAGAPASERVLLVQAVSRPRPQDHRERHEGGDLRGPGADRNARHATVDGLSTLPRLDDDEGGEGIRTFAEFLSTIRVLEPDVREARRPGRVVQGSLADDASNLASALLYLRQHAPEAYETLQDEMRSIIPGLRQIVLAPVAGSTNGVVVQLEEQGLGEPIDLGMRPSAR